MRMVIFKALGGNMLIPVLFIYCFKLIFFLCYKRSSFIYVI